MKKKHSVKSVLPGNTYAIYHRRDGTLIHLHSCLWLPGGEPPSLRAQHQQALHHAAKVSTISRKSLAVIAFDPRQMKVGAEYRVDLKRKRLVKA
jgi:hypothetical protein